MEGPTLGGPWRGPFPLFSLCCVSFRATSQRLFRNLQIYSRHTHRPALTHTQTCSDGHDFIFDIQSLVHREWMFDEGPLRQWTPRVSATSQISRGTQNGLFFRINNIIICHFNKGLKTCDLTWQNWYDLVPYVKHETLCVFVLLSFNLLSKEHRAAV